MEFHSYEEVLRDQAQRIIDEHKAAKAAKQAVHQEVEVRMANLAEVLKVERLWAEEAKRRLEEYRAGRAHVVRSEEVHEKAERLFK